jgi:hypothetical protein
VRRRRKNRQKTSPNAKYTIQLTIMAALLGAVCYFLLTNPRFIIKRIHVDGVHTVNVDRIALAAAIPAHSNIFFFVAEQRSAFCKRIEACDPAIQNASVAIDYPNALRLHIQERQPSALLRLSGAGEYLMDASRIAYRPISIAPTNLPVVAVESQTAGIMLGKPLPPDIDSQVAAAYNVASLIASKPIGPMSAVSELDVDQFQNVSVRLQDQLLVKLGQADGLSERLTAVDSALSADPDLPLKAEYLDFTSNRPAIMQKAPAPVPPPVASLTPTPAPPPVVKSTTQ